MSKVRKSPFDSILDLITRGGLDSNRDLLGQFDQPYLVSETQHDDPSEVSEIWLNDLGLICNCHTRRQQRAGEKLKAKFTDLRLRTSGEAFARCEVGRQRYDVYLDLGAESGDIGGSCTCPRSNRGSPCEHTYAFALHLIAGLRDRSSAVSRRLAGLFDPTVERQEQLFAHLDLFAQSRSVIKEKADQGELEPEVATRLVWQFVIDEDELTLAAMHQRPRKRGGGWTKGKRVDANQLLKNDNLLRTGIDRKVVATVKLDDDGYYYGYRQRWKFDIWSAASHLIGHDLVMLGDAPATVARGDFRLRVVPRPSGVALHIGVGNVDGVLHLFLFGEGIIACHEESSSLYVVECDESQRDLARFLMQADVVVPPERQDELLQRVQTLRASSTIEVPTELAGPLVAEDTASVALLGCRADGQVDLGMRVHDAQDRLMEPGTGVMIRVDQQEDGQTVQRARDGNLERAKAQRLLRRLDLSEGEQLSEWNWLLPDIGQALRLIEKLEQLEQEGQVELAWDKSSERMRMLGSVTAKNVQVEVTKKRDWFGLGGVCRVGDQDVSVSDLLSALGDSTEDAEFTELRPGQWARISAELKDRLRKLRDVVHRNRQQLELDATAAPVVQELLEAEVDLKASKAWRECLQRLDRAKTLDPAPPAEFTAELRDYQLQGYKWLRRLAEWGVGGCLADDMGLGKTIQALAVLVDRAAVGPSLVIAPTSVGFNWQREAERFAPTLKPHLYRETERGEFLPHVGAGDLVICSYGLALRDAEHLATVHWGSLVLDEAQFIKNSRSKTAQAIRTLSADWRFALTGTPVENHLGELWSVFRAIGPGVFGSWEQFRKRFASPIERQNDEERRGALSHVIRPFILRRTKSQVLTELPERTEMNLYVDLSPAERARYDEMRLSAIGELDQIVGEPETQDQRFRVLAVLTRLRQFSCHVGLVDESWEDTSAKLDLLVETLRELRDEGHRALVFSQFTSFLGLIRKALDDQGISYEYLDGSTPAKERQVRVDRFQNGDAAAFLISLKAGGTGLNLTAADYVIHTDPWWNPAVEDQATDRAHRIGQTRPVMVYRLVSRGTVEEQILELHQDKRDLVAGVMEGTSRAGQLSTDELLTLIRGDQ